MICKCLTSLPMQVMPLYLLEQSQLTLSHVGLLCSCFFNPLEAYALTFPLCIKNNQSPNVKHHYITISSLGDERVSIGVETSRFFNSWKLFSQSSFQANLDFFLVKLVKGRTILEKSSTK